MKRLLIGIAVAGAVLSSCSSSPSRQGSTQVPGSSPPSSRQSPASASTELWTAPPDAMRLARAAGLEPEHSESLRYHVHAHLDVFLNGRPVVVSAGIGINTEDPAVHAFPNPDGSTGYGGIQSPCKQVCISPLHTHDQDGVLHTESKTPTPNHLGQFFVEWGVRLTDSCVGQYCAPKTPIAIYVNGNRYDLDPRSIELADFFEIVIVIGTPPADIPSTFPA